MFVLRRPTTTESFATEFDPPSSAGHNPPYGASITYYLNAPASGEVRLAILDEKGATIRTLSGTGVSGLNRVWWDLRTATTEPAAAQGGRGAGGGRGTSNVLVTPGVYGVKLSVDGRELATKLSVRNDPNVGER